MEKNIEKENMYINTHSHTHTHLQLDDFAVHLKPALHCNSTVFQLNNFLKSKTKLKKKYPNANRRNTM